MGIYVSYIGLTKKRQEAIITEAVVDVFVWLLENSGKLI